MTTSVSLISSLPIPYKICVVVQPSLSNFCNATQKSNHDSSIYLRPCEDTDQKNFWRRILFKLIQLGSFLLSLPLRCIYYHRKRIRAFLLLLRRRRCMWVFLSRTKHVKRLSRSMIHLCSLSILPLIPILKNWLQSYLFLVYFFRVSEIQQSRNQNNKSGKLETDLIVRRLSLKYWRSISYLFQFFFFSLHFPWLLLNFH